MKTAASPAAPPHSARSIREGASMRARLLAAALFLCGSTVAADQAVDVGPALSFSPATVTVAPGEAVIWTWQAGPHSTSSEATSGPEVWDSGVLSTGATFSHTFQTPGDYPYYCVVHSFPGGTMMNGLVRVAAAPTVTPTVPRPTPTPGPGGAAAIPALSGHGQLLFGLVLAAAALVLLAMKRG
jgi:plastocyanin